MPGGNKPETQGHDKDVLGNVVLHRLHLWGYLQEVDREQPPVRLKSWQIKAVGGEGLFLEVEAEGVD